ncbi:MAG: hypothetical protein GWN67_24500 [Phycisphaerae bacterium]|nr:hypothetical protein [Phycisphaerae bacterium]NIR66879.1 hypothetical protein [candidate division Zixibacteria bacterium]NIP51296.1 hypothetical protein [Phycisphaerae bacterium]NIS54034.1 hypothetical protein [Phycisphaerae bacterium]NIU11641.1 hypothetical protein [Phycisphaerae bacterium]
MPATKGVLVVEVTNATANGAAVAGDEVIVGIYEKSQMLHSLNGEVDADGKAVFEDVPVGDNIVALARAKHQDMMFSGRVVELKPTQDKHLAHVEVYDVSLDRSYLSVGAHHIMIKVRSEYLEISEYLQLINSSDMAVSSSQKDSQNKEVIVEIMLPEGFKNLKPTSYFIENALVVTEQGFYDTMAIPPGEFQANFTYTLDITSNTMDIVKGITLPTSNLIIFAELGQAELRGLGDTDNQVTNASGAPMKYYQLRELAPNEKVAFQIVGFNVGTSALSTWIILSLTFGVIAVLVVLRLRPKIAVS